MEPTQQQVVPVIFVRQLVTVPWLYVPLLAAYDHVITYIDVLPATDEGPSFQIYDQSENFYYYTKLAVGIPTQENVEFVMQDATELVVGQGGTQCYVCISGYRLSPAATVLFS